MTKEVKDFFKEMQGNNQSFLFYRLYYNPSSVLGSEQDFDDAEEEYYKLPRYYDLMLNNNLLRFLEVVLNDSEASKRLDVQLCRKLSFFLYDSIDFKKHYSCLKSFNNGITVKEYSEKLGLSIGDIIEISFLYEKYKHLLERGYSKDQVDSFDETKAESIRRKLNLKISIIQDTNKEKNQEKEIALISVAEDDYSGDIDDIYLYTHPLIRTINSDSDNPEESISYKVFDSLACDNRFLDIVEQLIEKGEITGIPLDNVISIVDLSIRVKSYALEDAVYLRERLGNDLVNNFDLERAKRIQSELLIYKGRKETKAKSKIISFGNTKHIV